MAVDESGCQTVVDEDGNESNTCELSVEDLEQTDALLDSALDVTCGAIQCSDVPTVTEDVAINVVNSVENLFRVDDTAAPLPTSSVRDLQAKFELVLRAMVPNLEFTSRDGTMQIKTSDTPEQSFTDPLTGQVVNTPAYTDSFGRESDQKC